MAKTTRRPDGNIEELPSGKFRVRVSAGKDPVTGRARYLRETVATKAEAKAAAARLRNQVNEGRHARTDLTLNAIVRQWFEVTTHEASTRERYEQIVRLYIEPTVGREKAGRIDVQMLETLYARLRRCRGLCGPKPERDHTCAPLAANTVRKVHFVIRASLDNAVRWGYVGVNVAAMSRPPAFKSTEQDPPSLEEAEALLAEAARDPEWALLLWLTMTLGWRRGELCALRWSDVDLRDATITIRRSLWGRVEKGTKTHQVRRVAIDEAAVLGLTEHLDRCKAECAAADSEFTDECFVGT
ncbi:MAG: tyrosine-type recombinase/integrase [Sporichthyaceae bacterium]